MFSKKQKKALDEIACGLEFLSFWEEFLGEAEKNSQLFTNWQQQTGADLQKLDGFSSAYFKEQGEIIADNQHFIDMIDSGDPNDSNRLISVYQRFQTSIDELNSRLVQARTSAPKNQKDTKSFLAEEMQKYLKSYEALRQKFTRGLLKNYIKNASVVKNPFILPATDILLYQHEGNKQRYPFEKCRKSKIA